MNNTGTWYHVSNHAKVIREVTVTRVTPTIIYIDLSGEGRGLAHKRTTSSDQYFEHREDAVRCIIGWARQRLATAKRNYEREKATYQTVLKEYGSEILEQESEDGTES